MYHYDRFNYVASKPHLIEKTVLHRQPQEKQHVTAREGESRRASLENHIGNVLSLNGDSKLTETLTGSWTPPEFDGLTLSPWDRTGWIYLAGPEDADTSPAELRDLGYVEGRNLTIETRWPRGDRE